MCPGAWGSSTNPTGRGKIGKTTGFLLYYKYNLYLFLDAYCY